MSARDNGGPAFPCEIGPGPDGGFQSGNERWTEPGMKLRDYFAAQALPGAVAREMGPQGRFQHFCEQALVEIAENAYAVADAMLKARSA